MTLSVRRGLQTRALLEELLAGVTQARDEASVAAQSRKPKIVLKIAPDLTESDVVDIAEAVRASNIDGVIVSNTTISRPSHLRDGEWLLLLFLTRPDCNQLFWVLQITKLRLVDCRERR